MNIFKHITTYFTKTPQKNEQPKSPLMSSNSFEIITEEILQSYLREDFLLLQENKQQQMIVEQEAIQNMYVKDYFLIGKKCEGVVLTLDVWKEIIKKSDLSIVSKKDLYFSIFQGIDYRIRKEVWQVLANTTEMKKKIKLTFFQLTDPSKLSNSELETIDKDVVRTSGITQSLKQLRQVLIAYVRLSQTNYTQGMNIIAGVLLRLLQIQNDKELSGHDVVQGQLSERVFWVLVGVMKWKNWEEVFQRDLSGLHRMLEVLKSLMVTYVPQIIQRIESLEWDLGIFAQYYVTICLSHCPPQLAPIILDLFLLDGENIVHSLLMRMFVINKQKILGFKDECLLMKYLKSQMLSDTYQRLLRDRTKAKKLQDFEINFLKTMP